MKVELPECPVSAQLSTSLLLSSTLRVEEINERNLDDVICQFVEIPRGIPDIGMRNFESEISPDVNKTIRAQSMFALYVLGKMTPTFDFWEKTKGWDVHDPS